MLLVSKEALDVLDKNTGKSDARPKELSLTIQGDLMNKYKVHKQKVKQSDGEEKHKSINTALDKHNKFYENINGHIRKEISSQEDEFSKAMKQRRERSVNRSLNRSGNRSANKGVPGKKDDDEDTSNVLKHLKLDAKNKIDNPFDM